jgi:TonB family protein
MSLNSLMGAFDLLGQAEKPAASVRLAGDQEPQLEVAWGGFHQSLGSSLRALFASPWAPGKFLGGNYFKDCWIERRIPRRAVIAAALWHLAFLILPFPQLSARRRNPAFENTELTWSGPTDDLPLLEIHRVKARPSHRVEPRDPPAIQGADAFHPRQRIFTDPVHPTHPRQTLINPAASPEPPKFVPNLPNMVQLAQTATPARPRLQISEETLKKLRPRERKAAKVTSAQTPDIPNAEQRIAEISLALQQAGPARPKVELNTGSAPRVVQRAQDSEAAPAPDAGMAQSSVVNGDAKMLIALSATPAPPTVPVSLPQGNLAARVSISPEGKTAGVPASKEGTGGAGNSSIGVSISGGNARGKEGVSGLGAGTGTIKAPTRRLLITKPEANSRNDEAVESTGPPNFAALPAGAKPEQVFASKRVYTMNVNMPNLNSATGSWILNFSELRTNPDAPRVTSGDLSGPAALRKIDPKYPPTLINEHVEGEVILYAIIRGDGSVDSIQLVRGIDEQLDANAVKALSQWKFRPAARQGVPVELEAIVHIPFHAPAER